MKKHFFVLTLSIALLPLFAFSQQEAETTVQPTLPKWVSDRGYWVIESNLRTPKQNIVYFYTMNHTLVYKEKIEGMKIKVRKTKVCIRLKKALEQAVAIWEATQEASENKTLVAVALRD